MRLAEVLPIARKLPVGRPFREEAGGSLQKWDGARELWAAVFEVFRLGLL
jgi:hypothetical protein